MKNLLLICLTFVFSTLIIRPASSQTIEMAMVPDSVSSLELDFTKLLISDSDQSLISGNFNLHYQQVLNKKVNLIGELNYINFKVKGRDAESGLSNIFIGAQFKTSKKDHINSSFNLGVYLPTASEEAQIGALVNLFDLPKFLYETTSIHVGYSSFIHYNNGFRIGYELGSDIVIPVGDNNGDTELLGRYAFSVLYKTTSGVYLQSELLGVASITEEGGFNDNSFHTYAFGFGYQGNKVGAGLYYRNYFDEFFSDDFNGIFGLEFNISL